MSILATEYYPSLTDIRTAVESWQQVAGSSCVRDVSPDGTRYMPCCSTPAYLPRLSSRSGSANSQQPVWVSSTGQTVHPVTMPAPAGYLWHSEGAWAPCTPPAGPADSQMWQYFPASASTPLATSQVHIATSRRRAWARTAVPMADVDVRQRLAELARHTAKLEAALAELGLGPEDSGLQRGIHQQAVALKQELDAVTELLAAAGSRMPADVADQASRLLPRLHKLLQAANAALKCSPRRPGKPRTALFPAEAAAHEPPQRSAAAHAPTPGGGAFTQHHGELGVMTVSAAEVRAMELTVAEREAAARKLVEELAALRDTTADLAALTREQGETLELVEGNTAAAAARAGDGVDELRRAREIQKSTPCVIQ